MIESPQDNSSAGDMLLDDAEQLHATLALLEEQVGDNYDPVRLKYIRSLTAKAENCHDAVKPLIEKKASQALSEFLDQFKSDKQDAIEAVDESAELFPDEVEDLQALLENHQFALLQRKLNKLKRDNSQQALHIARLTQQINQEQSYVDEDENENTFNSLLKQQELELLASFNDATESSDIAETIELEEKPDNPHELKSMQRLKGTWEQLNIDKLIKQAIKDCPENAGPLNPQMLSVKALTMMKDLSPQYMNRFIAYIDTLMWLEKAEEKRIASLKKAKKKK